MAHLYVIAGHGAGDPGATGNGYNEAERVRALANKIKERGGNDVTLGDMNRNYYADNGISSLNIPKDWQILELHLDSASASAKGGHVIIKKGFTADKYDTALANNISSIFPGRANKIVSRSDLANPNRAAAKGYPYRLLEVCFITNPADIQKFNNSLNAVADAILKAFDIAPKTNTNTGGNTMASAEETWKYLIAKKHGDKGKMTAEDMESYIEFNTAYLYSLFSKTASAAGDGTSGNIVDRVSYIDMRVRKLYETEIPAIKKTLDEINKKLK